MHLNLQFNDPTANLNMHPCVRNFKGQLSCSQVPTITLILYSTDFFPNLQELESSQHKLRIVMNIVMNPQFPDHYSSKSPSNSLS
nr:hypothetical protein Iba_chr02bCG18000 [Ipomoea batatas]